jgi:hypothetical protein
MLAYFSRDIAPSSDENLCEARTLQTTSAQRQIFKETATALDL